MNIKTKFNIGDRAFPKEQGEAVKAKITGIMVEATGLGVIIKYQLDINPFANYGEEALSPVETKKKTSKEKEL